MSFSCYQENHFYAKLVWDQAYAIYLIGKQLLPFISQYSTHFHSHLCIKERDMVSLRIALNWVSFCEAMQLLINYSICWHLNHFCFHNKENLDFLLNQLKFYGLHVPFYPWGTFCPTQKNAKLNESKINYTQFCDLKIYSSPRNADMHMHTCIHCHSECWFQSYEGLKMA